MDLVKDKWSNRCEAVRGTMEEISHRINYINAQPDRFVVATHRPTKVITQNGITTYETLIFYKTKI